MPLGFGTWNGHISETVPVVLSYGVKFIFAQLKSLSNICHSDRD